ncbi:MAG TPA: GNAT family N-acetyltransferase [Casimicrobiaceae bacterium]|nr:GNAT family N-acetyltransferase [Casimicrobiaceae bacterium]
MSGSDSDPAAATTRLAPVRRAEARDVPALEALIPLSARALQAATYATAQIEAALGTVFAVDRQLIADGTYFVAARDGAIVGCGGWSRRRTLFGGEHGVVRDDSLLDPAQDAARIRAFFVHPAHARQGIGRLLLAACEHAAGSAGFHRLELVATLAGEPLYRAFAFHAIERYDLQLPNGVPLPVVRMAKTLAVASAPGSALNLRHADPESR